MPLLTLFVTLHLLPNPSGFYQDQSCTGINHPQSLELLQQDIKLRRTSIQRSLQQQNFSSKTLTEAALTTVFIVRHADKMSEHPGYDERRFGNNPELTSCGHRQAKAVTDRLLETAGNISAVISSPFMRCLQTALPLASATGHSIRVETILSEDRQHNGPDQPRNSHPSNAGAEDWVQLAKLWDTTYSSPPIATPEGNEEYWDRVAMAPASMKNHVKRNASQGGTVVFFSHSGTSFSLAYGLCSALFNNSLEFFVRDFVEGKSNSAGLAVAGTIRILLNGDNECVRIDAPDNEVYHKTNCSLTLLRATKYSEDPGKYWRPQPGTSVVDALEHNYD